MFKSTQFIIVKCLKLLHIQTFTGCLDYKKQMNDKLTGLLSDT